MSTVRRLAGRFALPPAPVLLGWLVVAHVLLKLLLYPVFMHAAPHGDEWAYLNGGMALSNAVRDLFAFSAPDAAELDRNVVASGWFMPGMSIVLTPVYVVAPDAPMWLVRGYLGIVNLLLFLAVVRAVLRTLGPRWACVVVVVPGLVPSWVAFTYGAWGDLSAGLVLTLLLVHLVALFRGFRRGVAPSLREGLLLGLLAIAALYLRSSTSVLLGGLGVVTLLTALVLLRGRERLRAVGSAVVAAAAFLVLLAPWSLSASSTLGARVITTTTVPTVMAITFGDRDEVCFGECDPDSTMWFRPLRYAREVGRETGTSEVEVLQQMSDHALRDLTVDSYLDRVAYNLGAYSVLPNNFIDHLADPDERGPVADTVAFAAKVVTWVLYLPMILLGLVSLLFRARRSLEARLLDVLVKLSLGALLVQPFVHMAGGRYWTTAAPFLAMGAVGLLREREVGRGDVPAPPTGVLTVRDRVVVQWLGRVQLTLNVLTALVVAVLTAAVLI